MGLIQKETGSAENNVRQAEAGIKNLEESTHALEAEYADAVKEHKLEEALMLKEYGIFYARKHTPVVISEKTVKDNRLELENCVRRLEDAQLEYYRLAEMEKETANRGIAFIPYFRAQRREIIAVRIDEARNRLDAQAERLQSAFLNDFVAEISEAINLAKDEIDRINTELKRLPFGSDTYRFEMKPKSDRIVFFRICDSLKNFVDAPELYAAKLREDERFNHDFNEFLGIILQEEDEAEYTDYRRYFNYDMKITSKQGNAEITAELSKKQGSASNGEKQTPYFIILAASLIQCYPRQSTCARLAFIDEAFSALSRERIEQMVNYLESNSFQVIYAAPPEKINSIGSYINSTVSLVMTGRFTNAVEGLVAAGEQYA